jgi:hypothetical protein
MLQGDAKLLHQTLFENTNLKKELKVLEDEKTTSEEKFKNLSDQYLQLFNKFSLVNVRYLFYFRTR